MQNGENEDLETTGNCQNRVLHFSGLGSLQKEHTVTYGVRGTDSGWALSIRKCEDGTVRDESVVLRVDSSQAFRLRDFLFENAVPIENWQEIVSDVISAYGPATR